MFKFSVQINVNYKSKIPKKMNLYLNFVIQVSFHVSLIFQIFSHAGVFTEISSFSKNFILPVYVDSAGENSEEKEEKNTNLQRKKDLKLTSDSKNSLGISLTSLIV